MLFYIRKEWTFDPCALKENVKYNTFCVCGIFHTSTWLCITCSCPWCPTWKGYNLGNILPIDVVHLVFHSCCKVRFLHEWQIVKISVHNEIELLHFCTTPTCKETCIIVYRASTSNLYLIMSVCSVLAAIPAEKKIMQSDAFRCLSSDNRYAL